MTEPSITVYCNPTDLARVTTAAQQAGITDQVAIEARPIIRPGRIVRVPGHTRLELHTTPPDRLPFRILDT